MGQESRPNIQDLERVRYDFLLALAQLPARDVHDALAYLASPRAVDQASGIAMRAVVLDGLVVTAQTVPNMSVQIGFGIAFVPVASSVSPVGTPQDTSLASNFQLINKRIATASQAINAAGAGTRYDLIELVPGINNDTLQTVDFWDAATLRFLPSGSTQAVVLHGEPTIVYTAGSLGGTIPAPTAGRVPIAVVRVKTGQVSVLQSDIFDLRPLLADVLRARAQHDTVINVGEVTCDVAEGALTATSVQLAAFHVDGIVKGVSASVRTVAPLDIRLAGNMPIFFDKDTLANITASGGPGWLWIYLVSADDQGYRMSRGAVPDELAATTFSHSGWLLFSHVAPSLANGSLAPASALKLPALLGNGVCTPGTGKAVAVGCHFFGSSQYTNAGLRLIGNRGQLVRNAASATFAGAVTIVAEGTGTTTTSSQYADFAYGASGVPKGPVAVDLLMQVYFKNASGQPGPGQRRINVYESLGATASLGRTHANVETTWGSAYNAPAGSYRMTRFSVPDFPLARIPDKRDASLTGITVNLEIDYNNVSASGNGFQAAGSTFDAYISGYRWPTGPVSCT